MIWNLNNGINMALSKSQYIRGLQCHKSLWLYKNKPELRDTPNQAQESLFNTGFDVGDLAKQLFPNGVEIEFDSSNFDGMITKTKDLIQNGCEVIYEATFKENGIFAMADILVKNQDSWDIYEVKASTNVKEYHLNDASVQWYSLSNAINLNKVYIVHINNSYERNGTLDIKNLFSIVDITEEVQNRQYQIPFNIEQMDLMLCGHLHRFVRHDATDKTSFPVVVNSNTSLLRIYATTTQMKIEVMDRDGKMLDEFIIKK
jgi:hypothetical protein